MSRIGKQPIELPAGVKLSMSGNVVNVEGPKGKLSLNAHEMMKVSIEGTTVNVVRPDDSRQARSLHGLTRALVANMVEGVSKGFERKLTIKGVGYRAAVKGKNLDMQLGFSHPVSFPMPEGVEVKVNDRTEVVMTSIDKQLLGQTAAKVRAIRPPEPYGGKGIRYSDEVVKKKEGKSGAK